MGFPVASGTTISGVLTFPKFRYQFEGSLDDNQIVHESMGGNANVYTEFSRETREFIFRPIGDADLDIFKSLHDQVEGRKNPFFFKPDEAESEELNVRMSSQLRWRSLETPFSGGNPAYEVILLLITEPEAASVT